SDRVRFALGPNRRTHRLQWNRAGARISSRRARANRRPSIVDLADALLVQFQRRVSPFSLRRRRFVVVAFDFWSRSRGVAFWSRRFLFVAHYRRPDFSQLSV